MSDLWVRFIRRGESSNPIVRIVERYVALSAGLAAAFLIVLIAWPLSHFKLLPLVGEIVGANFFVALSSYLLVRTLTPNPIARIIGDDLRLRVLRELNASYPQEAFILDDLAHRYEMEHARLSQLAGARRASAVADQSATTAEAEPAPSRLIIIPAVQQGERRDDRSRAHRPGAFPRRQRDPLLTEHDALAVRRAFFNSVSSIVNEIAPSNLTLVLGVAFLLVTTATCTLAVHQVWYAPVVAFGEKVCIDASSSCYLTATLRVVADQLLKGLVVDVLEFFDADLLDYKIVMSLTALVPTGILLGLRIVPALVFFKTLDHFLQRNALASLIQRMVAVDEEEEMRRLEELDYLIEGPDR